MTQAPIKGKPFDRDVTFAKIVKYYIEKKQYTIERANSIAQKEVERQMKERKLK